MLKKHFAFLTLCFPLSSTALAQVPPDIDSLRWTGLTAQTQAQGFSQGDPLRLTWGFVNDGLTIPNFGGDSGPTGASDLTARLVEIYGSQSAAQAEFQQVFDRWESLSGLEYSFEANDDNAAFSGFSPGVLGTRADVRIGGRNIDGNGGVLAFNFFPNGGDMVIDTNDNFFESLGDDSLRLRNTIAHEHGHGIGIEHFSSPDARFLLEPFSDLTFDGPQYHDILLAHRGYGDVNEKSNGQLGNDSAALATTLGTVGLGQSVVIGESARRDGTRSFAVQADEVDFVSIDDTSDTDFYSFDVEAGSLVDISLEALGVTYEIGPVGGPVGDFDTLLRSDLALSLFDSDGVTLLATSNGSGLGGAESIENFRFDSAGTFFISVSGLDNADAISLDTQFYGLNISNLVAVPEPSSIVFFVATALAWVRRRRKS